MTAPAGIPWNNRGVRVTLPMRTVNTQNVREHWSIRSKRTKDQRDTVGLVVGVHLRVCKVRPPCVVTLTRIAPRKMDSDGNIASLKAVRDGVADALGIDDGSELIEWRYGQTKGAAADSTLALGYGVEIRIESRAA